MERAENNIISKDMLLVVTIPLLAVLLYGITARVFLSQHDSGASIVEAGEI